MGCGDSKEQPLTLQQQFAALKLNYLLTREFENFQEKEIFMAVNIMRARPQQFAQVVHTVKKEFPAAKHAQHTSNLIHILKKAQRKPPISINEMAMRATKQNTERVIALNEPTPTMQGNVAVFNQMNGSVAECVEYTHFNFNDGWEKFVALQMILEYGKSKSTPLLNDRVHQMGLCVGAHRQVSNLINCLYIIGEQQVAAPVAAPIVAAQPVAVAQPAPVMAPRPVVGGLLGRLKLHLKAARLQFHDGPMLERMSPFVTVNINGREERSPICEGGGKEPSWFECIFNFEVIDMNHIVHIVVRDKDQMIGGQMLGQARVEMIKFARPGGSNEWIELFMDQMPAGKIHFKSEYFPQAAGVIAAPVQQPAPVVMQQPAPIVQQPAPMMQQPVVGGVLGRLKLHLKAARLQFHDGPMLERMSPYVTVTINGREERSPICEGGGREPQWFEVHFNFEVIDMNHEVHIVVRDKDMMIGGEMLGQARVPMGRLARPEGANEWIELHMAMQPAGMIHFISHYEVQAAAIVNTAPVQ